MAGSGFDDPSDPGYVKFLEGKFLESQRAGKDGGRIESALDNIIHRLDTLETRLLHSQLPQQHVSRKGTEITNGIEVRIPGFSL